MVTHDRSGAGPQPSRRAWACPSQVEPDTGTATQLRVMRDLVSGNVSAPEFARSWLAGRRRALDAEERVRQEFDRILTRVFYLLDDYAIDPTLRGPEDLADEDVVAGVRAALNDLNALDEQQRRVNRSAWNPDAAEG